MSDKTVTPSINDGFRLIDLFVLVFFLFTAAAGLYFFRQDLMRTIEMRDEEPAGIIVIRNNVVQRRHDDRVLWDRIFVNSLVYPGDLIRAADLSSAAVNIDDNGLSLNENTLIRIQRSADRRAPVQVELHEGTIGFSGGAEGREIVLNMMGHLVKAGAGTVLNASVSEEGLSVYVSEGTAEFIEDGQSREITQGMMVALDPDGSARTVPAAVVMRPAPNARYLKSGQDSLPVNFSWNRINIDSGETLSLEIASDRNFTRDYFYIDGLGNFAQAYFDAGHWYWRLLYADAVLNSGQITIADASAPAPLSPAQDSLFRYQHNPPQLRFQWTEKDEASGYLIELSRSPGFENPQISRQTTAPSLIFSQIDPGTWYWRVKPVFPLIFEGETAFSFVSSFQIEKTDDPQAPAVEIPERSLAAAPRITPVPQAAVSVPGTQRQGPQASVSILGTQRQEPQASVSVPGTQRQELQASEPQSAVSTRVSPAQETQLPGTGRYYTIQSGDTLGRIARQEYGNALLWTIIAEANNIQNPDLIFPDQVFFIP